MTLDKHNIDGLPGITSEVLPAEDFEVVMKQAGYETSGSAPARGNRIKVWWVHDSYRRVEAIYSPDKRIVITAYHPS
jgi:hypothetical protein